MNEQKLHAFVAQVLNDFSAAASTSLVLMGDRLGLYSAMAGAGPLAPEELAARTGTDARYVREWLSNQAAGGYVDYDAETGRFTLPDEHAMVLANPESPVYLAGAPLAIASMYRDEPKITEAFRSGRGVGWHEHDGCLFCGTARFFRTAYQAHLLQEWIPALDGVQAKLERGALVADVGCGHGTSTLMLAQAFPASTFVGFDYHEASIECARQAAEEAGLADRVTFQVASAKEYPGSGYDLVTFFDCLHDLGDPVGAAAHVRETLAEDGAWMVVEPMAGDRLEDNLHPVGRFYYAASTMICTPASRSQEVGLALGTQAGEARLRDVICEGGFSQVRRATETPFSMVLEARP